MVDNLMIGLIGGSSPILFLSIDSIDVLSCQSLLN